MSILSEMNSRFAGVFLARLDAIGSELAFCVGVSKDRRFTVAYNAMVEREDLIKYLRTCADELEKKGDTIDFINPLKTKNKA